MQFWTDDVGQWFVPHSRKHQVIAPEGYDLGEIDMSKTNLIVLRYHTPMRLVPDQGLDTVGRAAVLLIGRNCQQRQVEMSAY